VGHFAGAKKFHASQEAGWMGLGFGAGFEIISFACLLAFAPELASLYTHDESTHHLAVVLLRTGAFFQMFDGLQVIGYHILRGLHDTAIPFLNTVIAYWIFGLPISWGLAFHTSLGIQGIWVGMILSLLVAAGLHIGRFQLLSRRLLPKS
jgi:MATE family multidrug resistance protein